MSIVADVDLSSSDFADAIRGSNAHFSTAVGTSIEIVDGHRRLQTGETVLTFKFQVICNGAYVACNDLSSTLTDLKNNPAASLAHAQALIDGINEIGLSLGFSSAVISVRHKVLCRRSKNHLSLASPCLTPVWLTAATLLGLVSRPTMNSTGMPVTRRQKIAMVVGPAGRPTELVSPELRVT
jgi:hypothetical protein